MAINDDNFESVVREHEGMLYRIAFNFFLSASIAEEIIQDVFFNASRIGQTSSRARI